MKNFWWSLVILFIWLCVVSFSVSLAHIFKGEYFIPRFLILLPVVYFSIKKTVLIFQKKLYNNN